ncbi:MAG: hypothetical protein WB773_01580 [Isosphaeraceae bacterium]
MAVICDTSGTYALYDTDDAQHKAIATLINGTRPVVPPGHSSGRECGGFWDEP